jgi:two-component system sensor histidine kinase EvgS
MGGQLQLDSEPGRGTRVDISLVLPALQALTVAGMSQDQAQLTTRALSILVVDDYPANRLLLSRQLSYLGHHVVLAEDGAQGLEQWRADGFDLIITDCNMPVLSGYELAGAIREQEHLQGLASTLILGFTANAQAEEKARCQAAGMDDCLFKPIRLVDLQAWLAQRFSNAPSAATDDHGFAEFDLSGLERYANSDRELIDQLMLDLALTNREDRVHLLALHAGGNRPGLQELAHRIKGGALMVRALGLVECCERLERACHDGRTALVDDAVDQLQQAMTRLDQSIGQG